MTDNTEKVFLPGKCAECGMGHRIACHWGKDIPEADLVAHEFKPQEPQENRGTRVVRKTESVFWDLWRFWIAGLVFFGAGVALLAYEIHIHAFIVSGYMILALWTGGIGLWATGATVLWEIKHGLR